MAAIITLTTDFGSTDGYVAAMKAVILSLNPEATLVDISHGIQPQNIHQGAFILHTVWNYFPAQAIHLVVVDPGVGTNRRPLILKTPRAYFVAPDNGVLSYVIKAYSSEPVQDSQRVKLGADLKAYVITKTEYWHKPVSDTFHGRDIFAPVAARLSLGMPPASLGENVETVTVFPIPQPVIERDVTTGQVMHVDSFGNLITNVKADGLPSPPRSPTISIAGRTIRGLRHEYAGADGLIALIGSSGYLEISLPSGSAAELVGTRIGEPVTVSESFEEHL